MVTGSKTGSDSYFGITVQDTSEAVNLTLNNCTIQGKDAAIEIKNAALNLTLEGSSSLESNQEAISVSNTASLVIDGTGSVKAQSTGSYSAIGSFYANTHGDITINGGNIKAFSDRGTAIGKGSNSPRDTNTSVTDGNGNSVSKVTYTVDGLTTPASVVAITGCNYGVNDVSTLDTNKLYFYLPSGASVDTVTTKDGKVLHSIFMSALRSMDEYNCDPSCYNCLRSYENQKIHDLLDRKLAIEFLKQFVGPVETLSDETQCITD